MVSCSNIKQFYPSDYFSRKATFFSLLGSPIHHAHRVSNANANQWALSYIWSKNFSHLAFRKVKPRMAEFEGAIRKQQKWICRFYILWYLYSMNVLCLRWPRRKLWLTFYSSRSFCHLWLHFLDAGSHSRYTIELTDAKKEKSRAKKISSGNDRLCTPVVFRFEFRIILSKRFMKRTLLIPFQD